MVWGCIGDRRASWASFLFLLGLGFVIWNWRGWLGWLGEGVHNISCWGRGMCFHFALAISLLIRTRTVESFQSFLNQTTFAAQINDSVGLLNLNTGNKSLNKYLKTWFNTQEASGFSVNNFGLETDSEASGFSVINFGLETESEACSCFFFFFFLPLVF